MIQVHYLSILLCIESENLVEKIRSKLICCLPKDFTDSLPCVLSTTRDLTRRSWTSLQIPSSFEVSRNQDFELNSTESKTCELIKIVKATEPTTDTTSQQTGDNSHTGFFVGLMILSGGALLFIGIKQKKLHAKGTMSLILCFAMAGAMLPIRQMKYPKLKILPIK